MQAVTLAAHLAEAKLTHEQFAKRVRVARVTITRILAGDRRPSLTLALRIEKVTGGKVAPGDFALHKRLKAAA